MQANTYFSEGDRSWLDGADMDYEEFDYLYDLPDDGFSAAGNGDWHSFIHRFLAAKEKEAGRMDYSALSVAVMTLGLILVVEVLRHRLDHWAIGKPYAVAVLENIYAELTTLGIVEFFVFLLQRYHTAMNKAKKNVFGDVHFALFYTAILNAFQSVILAFITTKLSNRVWVQTEALELNHYVEVREEFERVEAVLFKNKNNKKSSQDIDKKSGSSTTSEENGKEEDKHEREHTEQGFDGSWRSWNACVVDSLDYIRRPALWHKYNSLLVQVRFHELRVHFLQSYNLPANFRVSEYLVRCQLHVLIKLVHVSSVAWLLLTASFNLLYFVLGVVGYFEESPSLVGVALIYVFYFSLFGFVALALLVFNKMKFIFQEIMHRNELWESKATEERHKELARQQMQLFWFASPKLVISALQFMQFGYAVALATVLMFWETINNADIKMGWYFMAILLCYSIFVAVAAHVIPRYTLCTSLGQLVDKDRLNQTVAKFHLEEVKRQREEEAYMEAYNDEHPLPSFHSTYHSFGSLSSDPHTRRTSLTSASSADGPPGHVNVEMDLEGVEKHVDERANRRSARRAQRKSVSDGVALMASIKDEDLEEEKEEVSDDKSKLDSDSSSSNVGQSEPFNPRNSARSSRRKAKSDGVASMSTLQSMPSRPRLVAQDSQRIAGLVNVDTASLRQNLPKEDLEKLNQPKRRTRSRSNPDLDKTMGGHSTEMDESGAFEKKRPIIAGIGAKLGFLNTRASKEEDGDFDDNLSDVDDIPGVNPAHLYSMRLAHEAHTKKTSFKEQCQEYYLSSKFPVSSNVFGTMVAFFLVGSRVERFLHTEDIVARDFISFDFNETATFWILSVYFFFFIISDVLALYSIDRHGPRRKCRSRWLASAIDIVIVAVCWIVLWVAEIQRCCTPSDEKIEDERWLAGEEKEKYDDYYGYGPTPCSCPSFGSRLYGGLGEIEPFTSLIALRLFRFFIARKIVRSRSRALGILPTKEELDAEIADENNLDPFMVAETQHGDNHGNAHDDDHGDHGHGEDRGTAAELWEMTMAKHPEVVEQYGMFSAEMLQVMLGIPLATTASRGSIEEDEKQFGGDTAPVQGNKTHNSGYKIEDKFSSLSLGAQEIIMQGKLGKTVKTVTKLENLDRVGPIPEDAEAQRGVSHTFQLSDEQSIAPTGNLDELLFDVPNARLVRSMRRCDRKLLPILNKWTVVDVVMTRFEMVYFDATGSNDSHDVNFDCIRQALKATKGGKGLRLKDVAVGRKVVGHMPITEISSLAIERYMPGELSCESDNQVDVVPETEFWKEGSVNHSRHQVWHKIKQDMLAVHTTHGNTLYLRFYSDLEEAEAILSKSTDEPQQPDHLTKNNAFQWVQTLGRFCGPEQLHQSLPHFGEDNNEELRDYLVIHQHNEHKRHFNFLANHGTHMNNKDTVAGLSERSMKRFPLMKLSSFHHVSTASDGADGGEQGGDKTRPRASSMSPRRTKSPPQRTASNNELGETADKTSDGSNNNTRGFLRRPSPIRRANSLGDTPSDDVRISLKQKDDVMPTLEEGDGVDHSTSQAEENIQVNDSV